MICSQCGVRIIGDAKYCHLCGGVPLEEPNMVEQESQVENVIPAAPITNEIFVHPPMHEAFATPIANETPVAPQMREAFAMPMTNESPAALPMRYPFATPAAPAAPSTNENPVAPPMRYAFATPMTSESPAAPPMRYAFATPITKENPVVLSVQDLPVLPMDAFVSQIIGENATRKAEERSDYTAIPVTFEKMGKTAFPADLLPVDPMAEEKADGMEKPLEVITPIQQAKTPKVSEKVSGKVSGIAKKITGPKKKEKRSFSFKLKVTKPVILTGALALVLIISAIIFFLPKDGGTVALGRSGVAQNYINAVIAFDWDGVNKACVYSIDEANAAMLNVNGISKDEYAKMLQDMYATTDMKEAYQVGYKEHAFVSLESRYGKELSFSIEEIGSEKKLSASEIDELKTQLTTGTGSGLVDIKSFDTVYLQKYRLKVVGNIKSSSINIQVYIAKFGSDWKVLPTEPWTYYDLGTWNL